MRRAVLALLAVALALPASAGASGSVEIRRVDLGEFPRVRVTAVAPAGSKPTVRENGRRVDSLAARPLGAAQAMMLAVDNSASMKGAPLREAKRAAADFLARQDGAGTAGLVAFGHEALALTEPRAAKLDVARTIAALAHDTVRGTALYEAVELSALRLQQTTKGSRLLVLLTDGRDVGSANTLTEAIDAAKKADVVVYAIATGHGADRQPLAALAAATGGRLFDAADSASLGATYASLSRELDRTWQLTYLTRSRPADRVSITVGAGGASATETFQVPGNNGDVLVPAAIAKSRYAALAVVLLAALLLAAAGFAGNGRRRTSEISRLLEPHVKRGDEVGPAEGRSVRFGSLFDWTERSLEDLPGSERLARAVERSGAKLRLGQLPYLAGISAFFFGIVGTMLGTSAGITLGLMLFGLAAPMLGLRIAARRRTKAFDKQLPDVLATVASTMRAGHGLRPALRGIADDGSPPASEEFRRVLGEERLGRPLDEAIAAMCKRVGSPDLDYVATAISVQSQAGGSLAALFDTLSETIRERQRHARKVKALTSMGRMSAVILLALPIGLASLMTAINPSYMEPLWSTHTGHVVIGVCLVSMSVGALVLKKIVNVRY
jgi:tight adherence protein B